MLYSFPFFACDDERPMRANDRGQIRASRRCLWMARPPISRCAPGRNWPDARIGL